jgi:hypothetical protein
MNVVAQHSFVDCPRQVHAVRAFSRWAGLALHDARQNVRLETRVSAVLSGLVFVDEDNVFLHRCRAGQPTDSSAPMDRSAEATGSGSGAPVG